MLAEEELDYIDKDDIGNLEDSEAATRDVL